MTSLVSNAVAQPAFWYPAWHQKFNPKQSGATAPCIARPTTNIPQMIGIDRVRGSDANQVVLEHHTSRLSRRGDPVNAETLTTKSNLIVHVPSFFLLATVADDCRL